MRLICPGCGAQYEVEDGVIPDAGRDVQCSACGHVWFQKSSPILLSEEKAVALPEDDWEPPAPQAAGDADVIRPAPVPGEVPRRALDDSLLAILREEAEREAQARRAESALPETQEEMILEPAPQPTPPPKARDVAIALALPKVFAARDPLAMAMQRAPTSPAAPVLPPAPEPAAALPEPARFPAPEPAPEAEWDKVAEPEVVSLPDVGEINSSLRASVDRGNEPAALDAPQVMGERRAGFRRGFGAVMLAAAAAVALYGFAPRIAQAVPALAPAMERYVMQVNSGRIWLDENLRAAISEMQGVLRG
ncbi:zinc-ribbon domain-containing protein [Paenirhodobacter sp.]|uniref:zinc-ribbon domain-containing protein n=1 Tax=Paenirhodobacter sp. TaxID=1965326 RepID=UPI003B3D75D9